MKYPYLFLITLTFVVAVILGYNREIKGDYVGVYASCIKETCIVTVSSRKYSNKLTCHMYHTSCVAVAN